MLGCKHILGGLSAVGSAQDEPLAYQTAAAQPLGVLFLAVTNQSLQQHNNINSCSI